MAPDTDAVEHELDMSNNPVAEGLIPSWDTVQNKSEKVQELDDKTLGKMYRRGMADEGVFNTMDAALAQIELTGRRDYEVSGNYENRYFVKDGERV